MKVLFLTSTLPRFPGDQQAPFVLEQAVAWQQARPEDELFILAPHDAGARRHETVDGVSVSRFRYVWPQMWQTLAYPAIMPNLRQNKWRALQIPFFLSAEFLAARRLIKQHRIEVIYAHWVMPQGIVAYLLHRFMGVDYVLQNHSSDLSVFAKLGRGGRAMARAVLRRARAFFCVNQVQADQARAFLPGLACNVLPMGLSMNVDAARSAFDPGKCRYALGTISRLSRKKGLDHLIAAAEHLARQDRVIPIAIAGDGEDAALLARLPVASDVTFPGFLSGEDKAAFFADCFAMVFSSVASGDDVEGLPVALLEALAAGKPVIASADTNITQLAEWPQIEAFVELLSDPSDRDAFAQAILRVTSLSSSQVKQMSAHLREIAGRYRWNRLIEEYLAVIEKRSG